MVEAIDEAALRFYEHLEFIPLPDHVRRLFIPMPLASQINVRLDRQTVITMLGVTITVGRQVRPDQPSGEIRRHGCP